MGVIRDGVALGFPVVIGFPIVIALQLAESVAARVGLAFLCGAAGSAIALTVFGILGIPLRAPELAVLLLGWLIASAWILRHRFSRWRLVPRWPRWHPVTIVVVLLTAVNILTAGSNAFRVPVGVSDVVYVWLPKADVLARTQSLLSLSHTTFPDYPPLWPLHLFLSRAIAGHATAVKLLPTLYLASLLAALFGYLSIRTRPVIAAATVWVISGIPYLWFPYGVNDLMAEVPLTAFLASSTLSLVRYVEENDIRQLAGAVLLATGATLTRPEGIQYAVLIGIVAAGVLWKRSRWNAVGAAGVLVPVLVYVGWHVAIQMVPHVRSYAVDPHRIPQVVTPDAIIAIAKYTIEWLSNPFVFGPTVIAAVLCVVGYRAWRTTWPWLTIFVLGLGAVGATYLIAPASNDQPLSWWLATGYKRFLLHIAPLLFVAAALAAFNLLTPHPDRPLAGRERFTPRIAIAISLLLAAALTVGIPGPGTVVVASLVPNGIVELSPGVGYGRQTADALVDDPGPTADWIRLQVTSSTSGSVTYDLFNLGQRLSPNDEVVGRFTSLVATVITAASGNGVQLQAAVNSRVVASTQPGSDRSQSLHVPIAPDARTVSLVVVPAAGGSSVQAVWVRGVLDRGGAWPLVALLLLVAAGIALIQGLRTPSPALPARGREILGRLGPLLVVAAVLGAALVQQGDALTNQAIPLWSAAAHKIVHFLLLH